MICTFVDIFFSRKKCKFDKSLNFPVVCVCESVCKCVLVGGSGVVGFGFGEEDGWGFAISKLGAST
jgi:hypothetical protein